jgi:hypothetical protein
MESIAERRATANDEDLSIAELREAIDCWKKAKAESTAREDLACTVLTRPAWKDHKPNMTLPDFVAWGYALEREAGTLTTTMLSADTRLYTDYYNWRRKPNLPSEHHWLRDLPTKAEKRHQLEIASGFNRGAVVRVEDFKPEEREVIRRYNAIKTRSQRVRRALDTVHVR